MPVLLGPAVLLVGICALIFTGLKIASSRNEPFSKFGRFEHPAPATIVVPEVTGRPNVFAKGTLKSAAGFSLIELLVVMVVLSIILGALTASFSSAFVGEGRAFARAQAEENARMALNRIRLDIHCSTGVSTPVENADGGWTVTLGENSAAGCAGLTGSSSVQWCTIRISPNRWRLYRRNDLGCDVNSMFMIDYLVEANPWADALDLCGGGRAEARSVQFFVNVTPNKPNNGYRLYDEIALRNNRC